MPLAPLVALVSIVLGLEAGGAFAAGKKPPSPAPPAFEGKRVVAIAPVRNVRIEMPDESFHDFGADFQASLTTRLTQSGRYIVADAEQTLSEVLRSMRADPGAPPDYSWPGSFVPAATVRVHVEALSFRTGKRGESIFYGFDERFRTPFNDGFSTFANEFPLRSVSFEPNWFDRTFDRKGTYPFDSQSGLDLGDGFTIDALFAWLRVKYALYRSEIHLRVEIEAPLAGRVEYRLVEVKGEGFFFDVAGAYLGYSAGIRVARRDAMRQAMRRALDGSLEAIERALSDLPLTARVDGVLPNGALLLGTGRRSDVAAGTMYEVVGRPSVIVKVDASNVSGSIGRLVRGGASDVVVGDLLRQVRELPPVGAARVVASVGAVMSDVPAATEVITLPWMNLEKSDLEGLVPKDSWWNAFKRSVVEGVLLPYRIWRYFMYDRPLLKEPYSVDSGTLRENAESWAADVRREPWARTIGLDVAAPAGGGSIVAVVDSGVDYNHEVIHGALWLNPNPVSDFRGQRDRYGWDFVSGDSRPADDGYHGTEVASAVLAVAPFSRIMALKAFNPWGVTSSAALLAAIRYAADNGARIIVCGWATRRPSRALEMAVEYARSRGVIVVAAAGDRGDDLAEVAAYPAVLSRKFDNVLTVTGVDAQDRLVRVSGRFANFGADVVSLAAPGEGIRVAEPRGRYSRVTTTAVAAGIAAGALARLVDEQRDYRELIDRLLEDADVVPALRGAVDGGRRLRIRHSF